MTKAERIRKEFMEILETPDRCVKVARFVDWSATQNVQDVKHALSLLSYSKSAATQPANMFRVK
jgi:hypothetical protein